jgi:hypothetical protein
MTEYVLFEKLNDGGWWEKVSSVEARSATSAIRAFLEGENGTAGEYAAVPARSWKPVTVKVETKTSLKFSS